MYQPVYHHKPEGQIIFQTFHGYPFKVMGHGNWERMGLSELAIADYDRRAAEWNYLISPAPYATPLLTREFAYHGQVLEVGYPRNDVLLSPQAPLLREQVRAALGITPEQTAVLYAPTYRDIRSADGFTAAFEDLIHVKSLASALGPDFKLLVRGHAFNARSGFGLDFGRRVLNVTNYPEVADLYLAADAAVTDYSSLRFDFAVTGKPMVFFVPDLEEYRQTRGWVIDYEPTAPGPFATTGDEVVDLLRDLDGVRTGYAEQYATFRRDYIPLEDGHAATRVVDAVFVPNGDAPAKA
jgi:CDP-glycerol glycerophosphotransferase